MEKNPLLKILERLGGESRIHYSLDHFTEALRAAGSPEKTVKTIVIAGTNGKGTVSLLVSAALKAAGYRVGTYLSPHLESPMERFLDNGVPVSLEVLSALAEKYEALAEAHRLTYFEFLTLLCFVWAGDQEFDYLVLEVGLGGRLDATNVTNPLATAITTIDWDHQKFLGNTLEAILEEKMGILRTGVPVFSSVRLPSLRARLDARCSELATQATYGWQTPCHREAVYWEGQRAVIDGHPFTLRNCTPGFLENAVLAYRLLRDTFADLPVERIQKAFSETLNPGRMEVVQDNPRVVFSGDHNPAGIECLIQTLQALNTRPRILCGFSPDKPHAELIARLKTVASDILLTQIPRFEHQMPPNYSEALPFIQDPHSAFAEMLSRCRKEDTLVVTGSLYLVGELKGAGRGARGP